MPAANRPTWPPIAIELAIAIVTVYVLLLILGGLAGHSDFIAVHFGQLVAVSFGANLVNPNDANSVERSTRDARRTR